MNQRPLHFPICYFTKMNILDKLPKKLVDLTWTCEIPKTYVDGRIIKCNTCTPCITSKIIKAVHSEQSLIRERNFKKMKLIKVI